MVDIKDLERRIRELEQDNSALRIVQEKHKEIMVELSDGIRHSVAMLDAITDQVFMVTGEGIYSFINKEHADYANTRPENKRKTSLPHGEVGVGGMTGGFKFADYHSKEETNEFMNHLGEAISKNTAVFYEYLSSDGDVHERKILPFDGGVIVYSWNMTHRKKIEEQYKHLSITDPLTGLYNRRGAYDIINKQIERAGKENIPLSMIYIDLDKFKDINDLYGHKAGDQVLNYISKKLKHELREEDVEARIGGDEFIAILPDTDLTTAHTLAERLKVALNTNPYKIRGKGNKESISIQLSASIGVTSYIAGESVNTFLDRADTIQYTSKHGGKDKVSSG